MPHISVGAALTTAVHVAHVWEEGMGGVVHRERGREGEGGSEGKEEGRGREEEKGGSERGRKGRVRRRDGWGRGEV